MRCELRQHIAGFCQRTEVRPGDTRQLTATVAPDYATNQTITWTTSNAGIATVSGGLVRGVGIGTATITATSHNGKTATCVVTVTSDSPDITNITSDDSSVTLSWMAASGAIGYDLHIYESATGDDVILSVLNVATGTSVTLSREALNIGVEGGTYYFCIGAQKGGENYTYGKRVKADIAHAKAMLTIQACLDGGEQSSTLYGTVDVYINGELSASSVRSYSGIWPVGTSYEIRPVSTDDGYSYHGALAGSLLGTISLGSNQILLSYNSINEWLYASVLPDGVTSEYFLIEYRMLDERIAVSSPGSDWTQDTSYVGAYVNSGGTYESDFPLATSATRVDVGGYYYHWCGASAGNAANYTATSKYNHYDTCSFDAFDVVQCGADGADSRYTYYYTKWNKTDIWGYCEGGTTCSESHGARTYVWYRRYIYQDKVQQKRYTRVSDWTQAAPADGKYAQVRYKSKFPAIDSYEFTIPASTMRIEREAFLGTGIKSVHVPASCQSIGDMAFSQCAQLQYVYIENASCQIADTAFDLCPNVTIIVPLGSEVAQWALSHDIPIAYQLK